MAVRMARCRTTDISAGHIKLTSSTAADGKWYNKSGVVIDADSGIEIKGDLDLKFTYNGSYASYIYTDSAGDLCLLPYSNGYVTAMDDLCVLSGKKFGLLLASSNQTLFWHTNGLYDHAFAPDTANFGKLGTSTNYWFEVHCNNLYEYTPKAVEDAVEKIKAVRIKEDGSFDKVSFPQSIYHKTSQEELDHERQSLIGAAREKKSRLENMLARERMPEKDKLDMTRKVETVVQEAESRAAALEAHEGLNLGGMVSMSLCGLKKLIERVEALEAKAGT
jgi:hypothetical protein